MMNRAAKNNQKMNNPTVELVADTILKVLCTTNSKNTV